MAFSFGQRSLDRMKGVHPDLVRVMKAALATSPIDFMVLEGVRTLTRQRQLFAAGATKTMNSRHLTGHAIDIAPIINGKISWDWPLYYRIAAVVKEAAKAQGVKIEWGGDWRTFKDGPHWQLPWKGYPA